MAVMAAEPVLAGEAGGAAGAGAGGAGGSAGAAGAGAMPGLPGMPSQGGGGPGGRTVLLALGIALLWLAGVLLFLAFEGFEVSGDTTGGGMVKAMIGELAGKAAKQEQQDQGRG